jgi:hypothetical protein
VGDSEAALSLSDRREARSGLKGLEALGHVPGRMDLLLFGLTVVGFKYMKMKGL